MANNINNRNTKNIRFVQALTYDDVLLKPKYSEIMSRKSVDTSTYLTPEIKLNIPIISSNMDSVTESQMAIAMAQSGGIGIIHRFLSIEDEVVEVKKVKRNENLKIDNPITISVNKKVKDAVALMNLHNISGLLVINKQTTLAGILTRRDLNFVTNLNISIKNVMTKNVITAKPTITIQQAMQILNKHKIEKLPLVDENNFVKGLITHADMVKKKLNPQATQDDKGRLRVGAAVGVKTESIDRARELVNAGVDVLVLDIAHGHSKLAIGMLKKLKKNHPNIPVIAGNVATADGVIDLIKAGADAIKVGIGPGSICTTRIVTGFGVPQLSAILETAAVAKKYKIPIIADGGVRYPGDLVKALAAGASTVMLGSSLAGSDESPGLIINKNGMRFKVSRGMASLGANLTQQKTLQGNNTSRDLQKESEEVVPEGVEAMVYYKGKIKDILYQFTGGLRSGFSYCGANNIKELQQKAEFIQITQASLQESSSHDVSKI